MQTTKKIFPYIIIAILAIIIFYQKGCSGKKEGPIINIGGTDYEVIKHDIDTLYQIDTQNFYRKGKDITKIVEVVREIPANIDTLSILRDYYARVFYKDTFKLKDSLGYIVINDTITMNRIFARGFTSYINVPTIKETIYLKEIQSLLFLGPAIQLGKSPSFGGDLHLKTKKDMLIGFGLGFDLNASPSPYFRGSIGWKIK
jgi:hypothetical protein